MFIWYINLFQIALLLFFSVYSDSDLFFVFLNFAALRNLGRERGLEKVVTAFGNPLALDLRLPGMPLKVLLSSFSTVKCIFRAL